MTTPAPEQTPRADHYRKAFKQRKETSDLIEWVLDELAGVERELATLRASSQEWLPTAGNINALPEPIRKYIADLATRCDPAGDVTALTFARDQLRQLSASNYQLRNALRASSQRNPNTAVVDDPKAWNGDEAVRVELAGERGNKAGTAHAGLTAPSSGSLPNTSGTVTPATPSAPEAPMRHVGECATDLSSRNVCEGMHAEKVDKIMGLQSALLAIRALSGGHSRESTNITIIIDRALEEYGI